MKSADGILVKKKDLFKRSYVSTYSCDRAFTPVNIFEWKGGNG